MSKESKVGFAAMNTTEFQVIERIAANVDKPVVMLNLNSYTEAAEYPAGDLYIQYMTKLDLLLTEAGGSALWRMPIDGSTLGVEKFDEILAICCPSYQAFLNMISLPSSDENYCLWELAVANAQLRRYTDLPKQWQTSCRVNCAYSRAYR